MKGTNHLLTGAALLPSYGKFILQADRILPKFVYRTNVLHYTHFLRNELLENLISSATIGVGLYFLGTLLPDIDSPNSLLGKHFYLPIPHRIYTHLIYVPLLLFYLTQYHILFFFLGMGYLTHILVDALSRMGVCFFNPFGYRHYPSGAVVKKGHKWYFYRNNTWQEKATVFGIYALSLMFLLCV